MERLTERIGNYIQVKGNRSLYGSEERHKAYLQNAIIRLAAYEDTGLEPEEVTDLQRAWDMYGGEEGITAMLAQPPNTPLTLEELREMDGEPVWLSGRGHWCLVTVFEGGTFLTDLKTDISHPAQGWINRYGPLYRRKPKEV